MIDNLSVGYILQALSWIWFICSMLVDIGLGPVVQSIVSLTSSLRVISLTFSGFNIQYSDIFCLKNVSSFCTAKATHIFSAKNFSIFVYHSM